MKIKEISNKTKRHITNVYSISNFDSGYLDIKDSMICDSENIIKENIDNDYECLSIISNYKSSIKGINVINKILGNYIFRGRNNFYNDKFFDSKFNI